MKKPNSEYLDCQAPLMDRLRLEESLMRAQSREAAWMVVGVLGWMVVGVILILL